MGKLFRQYKLEDVLNKKCQDIEWKINSENDAYLAQINIDEYLEYIQSEFEMSHVVLHKDQISVDSKQGTIEWYSRYDKRYYDVDGITTTVFIPFTGEEIIFWSQSNTWNSAPTPEAKVKDNVLTFTIAQRMDSADSTEVKKEIDNTLSIIEKNLSYADKDINQFNSNIEIFAKRIIDRKITNYNTFNNFTDSLPFPIKRNDDIPQTFELPKVRRKAIIAKPTATKTAQPEPTLPMNEYDHILKICSDMSINIERNPKAFSTMEEEVLRTYFLVPLNSHYQGQATGETFNGIGKTDILIRNDNKNVFIAECKFWKGEKSFLEAIDQLLGYVTYRDTKTAILLFVRQKDFTNVLNKLQNSVKEHNNFARKDNSYEPPVDSAYRYIFKNKIDSEKELYLTVMAFHLPILG